MAALFPFNAILEPNVLRPTVLPPHRPPPYTEPSSPQGVTALGQRDAVGLGVLHGFREWFLREPAQVALRRSRRVRFEPDETTRAYRSPRVRVLLEEGGHFLGHLDQPTADLVLEVLGDRVIVGELLHRHPRLDPDDTPVRIWAVGSLDAGPVLDVSVVQESPYGKEGVS